MVNHILMRVKMFENLQLHLLSKDVEEFLAMAADDPALDGAIKSKTLLMSTSRSDTVGRWTREARYITMLMWPDII